jgi:glyoxylase-like metal-dependent hydrolase (beta-lactamase superfamily II)
MISIEMFTYNQFQENTYLLHDETGEAVVIDPGMSSVSEEQDFGGFVQQKGLKIVKVINTHCHIDHVLGNDFCCRTYGVELSIPKGEEEVLNWVTQFADMYDMPYSESPAPSYILVEGDSIVFGNSELDVIFAPGHSPGHVVLVNRRQRFIIGGDVLFKDSIGRMDLPGGDGPTLIKSIKEKLFTLPNDFLVYPGHGPSTQIGYEKNNNPFVGVSASNMFESE